MFCQQTSQSIPCVRQSRFLSRLPVLTLMTVCLLALPHPALGQAQPANAAGVPAATVPRLIRYQGVARDLDSKPLTGVVGVTLSLYAEQNGGAALWMETQNVQADATGHYSVLLGSTKADGMPSELFASAQARWIGVQIEQQAEQPRALLVSAPYALKAVDADTLGGLPPSAFVHVSAEEAGTSSQSPVSGGSANAVTKAVGAVQLGPQSAVTTSGGTAKTIPMFTTATNIQNSILTQT
jgi:trimeric autotransporter adhesin